jgi:hypothetical protein
MTKINLKKWLIVFVSFLGSIALAWACGWYYEVGDGINETVITPEAFLHRSYRPMIYSEHTFYGDLDTYANHDDTLLYDWCNYLQGEMSREEIQTLLYSPQGELQIATQYKLEQKSGPRVQKKGRKMSIKKRQFFHFLHLAKAVEKYAALGEFDPWDYEAYEVNRDRVPDSLVTVIENEWKKDHDAFLSQRYWHLVHKALYYSNRPEHSVELYVNHPVQHPHNYLHYKTLLRIAGCARKSNNIGLSQALCAVVFDESEALRQSAFRDFVPGELEHRPFGLKHNLTPTQQCALWAMFGYHAGEYRAMQAIYALDPASPHLGILLTRWINKKEINFQNEESDRFMHDKALWIRNQINPEEQAWIEQVAQAGRTHSQELWWAMAGYLRLLQNDYASAKNWFTEVSAAHSSDTLLVHQFRILNLLNEVTHWKTPPGQVEADQTWNDMHWLFVQSKNLYNSDDYYGYTSAEPKLRTHQAEMWIRQLMSNLYLQQGQPLKAELWLGEDRFYTRLDNVQDMQAFMANPAQHDPWSTLAIQTYRYQQSNIEDLLGIFHYYTGDLSTAARWLKNQPINPDNDYDLLPADPYTSHIWDCHDCDHETPSEKPHPTKYELVVEMLRLQAEIAQGKHLYENHLKLANAYYNTSYYGNVRAFSYNAIVWIDNTTEDNPLVGEFEAAYFSTEQALHHYTLAQEHAKNNEQRAWCAMQKAKCQRNHYYNGLPNLGRVYWYDEAHDWADFLEWEGFRELRDHYRKTKVYQQAIEECGYFRTYMED